MLDVDNITALIVTVTVAIIAIIFDYAAVLNDEATMVRVTTVHLMLSWHSPVSFNANVYVPPIATDLNCLLLSILLGSTCM